MNVRNIILNKLLDKYEISKALTEQTNRRILLKLKNLKEYNIEDYEKKKLFHDVVISLNKDNLVGYSWKKHEKRKHYARSMAE